METTSYTTLLNIVNEIYNSTTDYDERRVYYKAKYPEFVENYEYIFDMLCKPRFNLNKFVNIINNINKNKKRKSCSEEMNNYIHHEVLFYNLKEIFHQQEMAEEYFV